MAGLDWVDWHRGYEDPGSSLSQRLLIVRQRVGEALDALGPGLQRVLSLCSGDGRDLLPELAVRPALAPEVLLVELDPSLARDAAENAAGLSLGGVLVAEADAGDTAVWADIVPAEMVLLCGIFGNVSEDDIRGTLAALPSLVTPGGFVIWTRGAFADVDLRPAVRRWVVEAGFDEVAYDGEPAQYGVGMARRRPDTADVALPDRLFTFIR
jgi:hypothetical protein